MRNALAQGMEENRAMDYAITRTKAAGYLVDYLNKIEAEAKDMLLTEFNEKAYEEVVREEGREDTLLNNVESLMKTMKMTVDQCGM